MGNVWLEHVVPALGNLLCAIMLISPIPAVLRLRVTGKLGDLNPLPLPLTVYNSSGWLAYGLASANPYLFPCNLIGFCAGIFFTLTAHSAASRKVQDRIAAIFLTAAAHFVAMGIIDVLALSDEAAKQMWGINAVVILFAYYLVPLSTMPEVVRTRSAVSIYPPLAAASVATGGLWAIYGFVLKDLNLWLPNLFGAVIGVVQLILRAVYGTGAAAAAGGGAATPFSAAAAADSVDVPYTAAAGGVGVGAASLKNRAASGGLALTAAGAGGGGAGPTGAGLGSGRAGSGAISISVSAGNLVSAAAAAAAATKSGGGPAAEAPEDHPAAKHPAAKDLRRLSVLQLLHPFQHSHLPQPGGGGGAAGGAGGGI